MPFSTATIAVPHPARRLDVTAAAGDHAALASLRDTLTRHLRRCADGQDLQIVWTAPVSGEDMQIIAPSSATTCSATAPGPTACWAS